MTILRSLALLIVVVAANVSLASAQTAPCDASQFDALTNMWKLEPDQNTSQVPAGDNTYIFTLSNHKIECRNGKPAALDVSYGNVSVQVNRHFIGEAEAGDRSVGFSYLPRGYYQFKDRVALPQPTTEGIQEFNFADGTTVWWLTRAGALPFTGPTTRPSSHSIKSSR